MRRPPKLSLLRVFTITIILRAILFNAVSSAYFAQSLELSETWQSVQFKPREAEKNPMVPMNSLTEIPLRTWTFLKTSSAICGFCSEAVWPLAGATASRHTIIVGFHPSFMVLTSRRLHPLQGER